MHLVEVELSNEHHQGELSARNRGEPGKSPVSLSRIHVRNAEHAWRRAGAALYHHEPLARITDRHAPLVYLQRTIVK